jgi:cation transport regulator ChaB
MPAREELPSTLQRSPARAREIWSKAHDAAVQSYGEGERAHRTAFAALKHEFEKVGDRWLPKDKRGPSDPQAAKSTPRSRRSPSRTAGGVDANASKEHLYGIARKLDISGRSRMTKQQLVKAIQKENDRQTRKAAR